MTIWTKLILLVWVVWGAAWLAAWLWADRTVARASRRAEAPYRLINLLGFTGIFADGVVARNGWRPWLAPLWVVPPALGWACLALAVAGLALALWSRRTLGRLWSAAVTRKEGHRIVDSGPYALVRHPIYTALIAGATALAVAKGTPIALLGAGCIVVGYTLKARVEERFLAAELGPRDYAEYRRRVPMLVPFARP